MEAIMLEIRFPFYLPRRGWRAGVKHCKPEGIELQILHIKILENLLTLPWLALPCPEEALFLGEGRQARTIAGKARTLKYSRVQARVPTPVQELEPEMAK